MWTLYQKLGYCISFTLSISSDPSFSSCEPVTNCDQFLRFVLGKDKHEFRRKPICIAFDGLIENLCLNPVKFGKIPINHNLQAANSEYARLDEIVSPGTCDNRHFVRRGRQVVGFHVVSERLLLHMMVSISFSLPLSNLCDVFGILYQNSLKTTPA